MNFWTPIYDGEGVFSGKPVRPEAEYICRMIRGRNIGVYLYVNNHDCYIRVEFDIRIKGNSSERWNRIKDLFRCSEYEYEDKDTNIYLTLKFPVLNKGKNDQDDWDEIREKLINMGNDIYNIIDKSGL